MGKVIVSSRKRSKSRKRGAVPKKKVAVPFDPKAFLAKVSAGTAISKYKKKQIVFSQGDVGDAIFYIQKGNIKLTVVSDRGKEAVVGLLGPGQFFGEGCLNGHPLRVTTATAIDECLITSIAKAAMIATMHDEPKFSELFMANLLSRNSRIEEDLIDQLFNSSEKRLARALLLLANFGKDDAPEPIVGKFSQEIPQIGGRRTEDLINRVETESSNEVQALNLPQRRCGGVSAVLAYFPVRRDGDAGSGR
jgi:CRP/FNR family transcriptional regulator, cyclic AMP receptor protein